MQRAKDESPNAAKPPLTWTSPVVIIGAVVLAAFGLLVAFMIQQVAGTDSAWTRLVYLYGSVEAIVFAAAGAIFGTQVQRGQTNAAESRAKEAQAKADQHVHAAEAGRALASTIKGERKALPAEAGRLGFEEFYSPSTPMAATAAVVNRLASIADELFPETA
jgi:hypothetical protein